ncbi:hypothetical protein, conserved [Entamoeba dispar SAW760]|uniref:AAA+ ATPase domain-containing protein n=1 Tax=Entamoeba dispar (strain ATCC PRA-260 / SAW760) TaxID=370354 RepID=B0ETL6_ENTDS|nr:uncharacterized protein EDI_129550 [Entamoeba dispar SAW760]EDR22201.1 hypothetical protein, conserved [Entamoeba dispar SAW760]|eukprot:EDR22201.1 hypothetical protein, conserved [Entamoeba dispar SAW760]
MNRYNIEGKHPLIEDQRSNKRRGKEDNKKWGELVPLNDNCKYPPVELNSKVYSFSKSSGLTVGVECNFLYDEDRKKGYLEVVSQLGCVYVNQKPIRKGRDREKVILEDGNEIGFYFSETYLFKFHYCDGTTILHPMREDVLAEQPRQINKRFQTKTIRPIQTPSIAELSERLIYKPNQTQTNQTEQIWQFIPENIQQQLRSEFAFCLSSTPEEAIYSRIPSLSRTLLLTTPNGTELFVSRLLKRIANEMNVPLLEIDCTLLGAVDGVEQECIKNFQYGDRVKYIGKGKYSNEEQLGKIGTVLFVANGKVAVNFENTPNGHSGAFVEIDMLGGVDEEVPNQDRRLIGRLPEILKTYPQLIVVLQKVDVIMQLKNDVSTEIRTFINDFKKRNEGILVGCNANAPPPKSSHSKQIAQVDQGICMFSEKEIKMVDAYGIKGQQHGRSIFKTLQKMFGNSITIQTPTGEEARSWWIMMQEDSKQMSASISKRSIKNELLKHGLEMEKIDDSELQLDLKEEDVEKIVGWAFVHEIEKRPDKNIRTISKESIMSAIAMQMQLNPVKDVVDTLEAENEFEKKLMNDVIRAGDVDVSFDDIGALEKVKETLYESITLPLLRPELFKKGSLTKRSKGILFFGPPGTGKTMLAKAVAKESKANFINASLSSLESKWFGEAEKFVKALFSLAAKLSPCVIFIDEVDALLGKRTSQNENETLRKMKNEFMTLWDGLKSQNLEQIIVLGATNRPFDLDDAILRRFSRRILVDLPTKEDRENILKIILKGEKTDCDISKIAEKTPGYSGCDLFNLCCAAAMRPIRDYIAKENKEKERIEQLKKEQKEMESKGIKPSPFIKVEEFVNPTIEIAKEQIRAVNDNDFFEVLSTMNPSTNKDSPFLTEIRNWNEQFGENKQGNNEIVSYFI